MAEITVMLTAAFKSAYLELVPGFEKETGHRVASVWVSTVDIMKRLKAGEAADALIASAAAIDSLIAEGFVAAGGRVDLATCGIGLAVRAGASKPDISSADALRQAMLAAESSA